MRLEQQVVPERMTLRGAGPCVLRCERSVWPFRRTYRCPRESVRARSRVPDLPAHIVIHSGA